MPVAPSESSSPSPPPPAPVPAPAESAEAGTQVRPAAGAIRPEGALEGQSLHVGGSTYTLEKFLGAGGMGEVYRATQTGAADVSQRVAIKVIRRDMVGHRVQTFIHEARLHSQLRHQNINHIHGFYEHEGVYYLVMEYLEGQSLWHLLRALERKRAKLPEAAACELAAQVASALDYAHQAVDGSGKPLRVVHRDVTPSNIFVTWDGVAKLLDFGIALSSSADREQTGSSFSGVKGKPSYLSPEQVEKKPLDGRSDQFALGCVLVELLTGRRAFEGEWLYVQGCIQHITPADVDRMLSGLPRALRRICHRLLAREPSRRYATAAEAARALRTYARRKAHGPTLADAVRALEGLRTVTISLETQAAPSARPENAEPKRARWTQATAGLFLLASVSIALASYWYHWDLLVRLVQPAPPPEDTLPMPPIPHPDVAAAPRSEPEPAPPPAVAVPPRARPARKAPAVSPNSCLGLLTKAAMLVAVAGCGKVHIPTGSKAGDCSVKPVRPTFKGELLVDKVRVRLVSLNGKKCEGLEPRPAEHAHIPEDKLPPRRPWEPCPAEDGLLVIEIDSWFRETDLYTEFDGWRLYGRARFVEMPTVNTWDPRDHVGRLMALLTELRSPDGKTTVPVCGLLYGHPGRGPEEHAQEGIPVLDPKYFNGRRATKIWGQSTVKFLWPAK